MSQNQIIPKTVVLDKMMKAKLSEHLVNNINNKILKAPNQEGQGFSIRYEDGLTQENNMSVVNQLRAAGYNVQIFYANGKVVELYVY